MNFEMKKNINLVIFLLFFNASYSQNLYKQDTILQLFTEVIKPKLLEKSDYGSQTSTSIFFPFLFVYKSFLSEHDVPDVCRFEPTCGSYSALVVQKYGVFKGFLKTFDRLQRCNNLHYLGQYEYKPTTNLYIDLP